MAIPDYESLMLPVLRAAARGPVPVAQLIGLMADQARLSAEERRQLLPSGRTPVIASRVNWAKTYLKQAGLVSQPRRGLVEITSSGQRLLATNPARIDNKLLTQFPSFIEFKKRGRDAQGNDHAQGDVAAVDVPAATPEERIDGAERELAAALRSALLARIAESDPVFFERLVVDLVVAMGYGGSRSEAGRQIGQSGDGGVDGVIDEDRLGLDRIYLQAKRYKTDNRVAVEAVRAFAGALEYKGANKGILLTTAGFTKDAREFAERLQSKRIVLIDGELLAELMIRFDVGVREVRSLQIKRIDLDYFEEPDPE